MSTHNEICDYLKTVPVSNYNANMKNFMTFLNPGITPNSYVDCLVLEDNRVKPNLLITIDADDYYISVLSGQGNSVHEENPSDFIPYITALGANQDTVAYIHELCYCNQHTSAFVASQPVQRTENVRRFFENVRHDIILRAIKYGQYGLQNAEYIYWGDSSYGKFCTVSTAINTLQSYRAPTRLIPVGGLVLQRKNRLVNHNIQLKWSHPRDDI